MPIIFTMFGILVVSLTIAAIAWYYGTADWTWIAQIVARLVLVLMVLSIAFIALFGYLKKR
jgi:uncharacterized BrkB/YihY/UPF0761 family membrane protein